MIFGLRDGVFAEMFGKDSFLQIPEKTFLSQFRILCQNSFSNQNLQKEVQVACAQKIANTAKRQSGCF